MAVMQWYPSIGLKETSVGLDVGLGRSRRCRCRCGGRGGEERNGFALKAGDVVGGKYRIVRVLEQKGVGTRYEAESGGGEAVALKAISIRSMNGWEELEVFEKEARLLKSLQHPGIPGYLDYFQEDTERDRSFFIAQKLVKGSSLAQMVAGGWRGREEEVRDIGAQIAQVLLYLEGLRPPIVHRNIQPDNILMSLDGGVRVLDFGAAQEVVCDTTSSSTSDTWHEFMAPEQLLNRATAHTDLYGLGGTLLFLLSGLPPSAFPHDGLKVQFRQLVSVSPQLGDVVERLLEPAAENRFPTVEAALSALLQKKGDGSVRKPAGSKVEVRRSEEMLEMSMPAAGVTAETAATASFTLAWNAFLVCWMGAAVSGGAPVVAAMVSLPFWLVGAGLVKRTLSSCIVQVRLRFRVDGTFSIVWSMGRWWEKRAEGRSQDVRRLEMDEARACRLVEGVRNHSFGSGLQDVEKEWVMQEVSHFLRLPPPLLPKKEKNE